MLSFKKIIENIDPIIILGIFPLVFMSLSSLSSFSTNEHSLFFRQLIWFLLSFLILIFFSHFDISLLKKTSFIASLYLFGIFLLVLVLFVGHKVNGARSWFSFSFFSFQPADFMKIIFILTFAKFLEKRHILMRSFYELIVSFFYFILPFFLIFLQPDFGSAAIFLVMWFGFVLLSGLSKKHFFLFLFLGILVSFFLWSFVLHDYQKKRILTFLHPLSDIQGTGYNAYQSTIAIGSGGLFGKGVGYGTQSRLSFLPEYETDFIFSAISEEWGFVGSMIVLFSFLVIFMRLFSYIPHFKGNFERFFTLGFILYLFAHVSINIGMNIGLFPVTGVTLPFVSYGGSHLFVEFFALALIMGMRSKKTFQYGFEKSDAFLR